MKQKFKVWDKKNNCIDDTNDIYVDMDGDIYLIEERNWAMSSYMQREEVSDRYELVWYTGLKDKNGVEVYEGDICLGHREEEDVIYEILWLPHCAKYGAKVIRTDYVLSKGLSFPLQHYIKDGTLECVFEIIGNIYTHPHLLGSEKE